MSISIKSSFISEKNAVIKQAIKVKEYIKNPVKFILRKNRTPIENNPAYFRYETAISKPEFTTTSVHFVER
jgi:hypothetical protein